jgi:hypothetical protein
MPLFFKNTQYQGVKLFHSFDALPYLRCGLIKTMTTGISDFYLTFFAHDTDKALRNFVKY